MGRNICGTLGCGRYVADLRENREIYIPPPVFDAPVGGDPVAISLRCLVLGTLE